MGRVILRHEACKPMHYNHWANVQREIGKKPEAPVSPERRRLGVRCDVRLYYAC